MLKLNSTFIFGLLTLWLAFTGCRRHDDDDVKPMDPGADLSVVDGTTVETYSFDNEACQQAADASQTITGAKLWSWAADGIQERRQDLSSWPVSGIPLGSTYVGTVLAGTVFQRNCHASHGRPPTCLDKDLKSIGWIEKNHGRPLKICQAMAEPARDRLEHLAASAVIGIEKTGHALKTLLGDVLSADEWPTPLTLMVAPRFESNWTPWQAKGSSGRYQSVLADNMSYFPTNGSSPPFIAILPRTASASDVLRLWESPFVVAHEFSHHVEQSLRMKHEIDHRTQIRNAVSEGFADIMAFATLDANDDAITAIPCIGLDRSPLVDHFNNGVKKTIAKSDSDHADNSYGENLTPPCQGIPPASIHGIGAVFSYLIVELSKKLPHYAEHPALTIARISVAWLKEINSKIPSGTDQVDRDLSEVARAFEKVTLDTFANEKIDPSTDQRRSLCQKLILVFPQISAQAWFGVATCTPS